MDEKRISIPTKRVSRTQEWLALTLSLIAGYVDAYGYLSYKTYLSLMSGNTTQAGVWMGQRIFSEAAAPLVAILFFVIGIAAGTLMMHSSWNQLHSRMFALIAVLQAFILLSSQMELLTAKVYIAILSFAMGCINTLLKNIGAESLSLTFVTGTLSKIGSHIAFAIKQIPLKDSKGPWDTHLTRAGLLGRVWGSFLLGAFLSGATTPIFGAWILLIPILILFSLSFNSYLNKKND